jgi:ribosomal protein S27E
MDDTALRLDGNALAGSLHQIFAVDVTASEAQCAHCGRIEPVGAEHVYQGPGAVVRCRHCENVLMVLVEGGGRLRLALPGCRWLELPEDQQSRA